MNADYVWLCLGFAAVSFACRAAGFWLMGFLPMGPRVEAALRATPLGVMAGLVALAVARGEPAGIAALVGVALVMRWSGNDLLASLAGVGVVALWRAAG